MRKVEIVIVRDPDAANDISVFIDGEPTSATNDTTVTVFDVDLGASEITPEWAADRIADAEASLSSNAVAVVRQAVPAPDPDYGVVTIINYMHRDADNYKTHTSATFSGRITDNERAALQAHTFGADQYFYPEQVDIWDPSETVDLRDDDPAYSELGSVIVAPSNDASTYPESIHEFVARFIATEWQHDAEKIANRV